MTTKIARVYRCTCGTIIKWDSNDGYGAICYIVARALDHGEKCEVRGRRAPFLATAMADLLWVTDRVLCEENERRGACQL